MSFMLGEHTAEGGRETSINNLEILRLLEYMFKAEMLGQWLGRIYSSPCRPVLLTFLMWDPLV